MKSQFSYCSLIWIFYSRKTNNMINKLHEGALRIVLNDHISNFETLLQERNEIFTHHRSIQTLMIELYNIKSELVPQIMNSRLNRRNDTCNFRNFELWTLLLCWNSLSKETI